MTLRRFPRPRLVRRVGARRGAARLTARPTARLAARPALCLALVVGGCADGPPERGPATAEPPLGAAGAAGADAAALRAALSSAMATNRTLPYDAAWTVLPEAHAAGPGRIRLFYTRAVVPAADRAAGDDQAEPDHWNREHLWPQSYGLRDTPARTDLHNLVPADRTVNSSRGRKFYDEVSGPHHECAGCEVSRDAWEPPAELKGDVARAAFYMDVRYEGAAGDGVGDLSLSDDPDADARRFGALSTLIDWHCTDPVSAEEGRRHEAAARAQGNRNAFVDAPELAERVYGFECTGGR